MPFPSQSPFSLSRRPKPVEPQDYLAYRCQRCMRLLTKLELLAWRRSNSGLGSAILCPCGGGRICASNPVGLEWWLLRVVRLRLAVYASPPFTSGFAKVFGRIWRLFGGPLVSPPPPPPTPEEIAFAEEAKRVRSVTDAQVKAIAARLTDESIPLEEALIRMTDEEAGR